MPKDISGYLTGSGRRFAIAAARFNGAIVESLVAGAVDCLVRHGVDAEDVLIARCPGAWELPLVVQRLASGGEFDPKGKSKRKFDAIIALGCVIRGETPHFDYVAGECAKGLAAAQLTARIPVAMGVLTCETVEQAQARAGLKAGNKGVDAAMAAIEMANLLERL
jgi:6,7-dimethyl-8-ribityllumazine synthase